MLQIRGIVRSKDELKETRCTLKRNRAEYEKETQPLSRLIMQVQESFTPAMFGRGRTKGGTQEHKANRHGALENIRRISYLAIYCLFSRVMQHVLEKMVGGNLNAFSDFFGSALSEFFESDVLVRHRGVI